MFFLSSCVNILLSSGYTVSTVKNRSRNKQPPFWNSRTQSRPSFQSVLRRQRKPETKWGIFKMAAAGWEERKEGIYSGTPGIQRQSKTELEVTLFPYCSLEVHWTVSLETFFQRDCMLKISTVFFVLPILAGLLIASGRPDFHIYFDHILYANFRVIDRFHCYATKK